MYFSFTFNTAKEAESFATINDGYWYDLPDGHYKVVLFD